MQFLLTKKFPHFEPGTYHSEWRFHRLKSRYWKFYQKCIHMEDFNIFSLSEILMCLISVIACLKDPKECLFYIVNEFLKDIGDIWITFENIKWGNDNDHLPCKPEKPCPILKMSIVLFYCFFQKSKICNQIALMAFWISRQFTFFCAYSNFWGAMSTFVSWWFLDIYFNVKEDHSFIPFYKGAMYTKLIQFILKIK